MERIRESQYNELLKQYEEKRLAHSSSNATDMATSQPQSAQLSSQSKTNQAEFKQLKLDNEKLIAARKTEGVAMR